jgi:hypothetical protein
MCCAFQLIHGIPKQGGKRGCLCVHYLLYGRSGCLPFLLFMRIKQYNIILCKAADSMCLLFFLSLLPVPLHLNCLFVQMSHACAVWYCLTFWILDTASSLGKSSCFWSDNLFQSYFIASAQVSFTWILCLQISMCLIVSTASPLLCLRACFEVIKHTHWYFVPRLIYSGTPTGCLSYCPLPSNCLRSRFFHYG